MKPRKMKMSRNFTLISKKGYIVEFQKDKVVDVPALCIDEAVEKGAGFAGEDENFAPQEDLPVEQKPLYGPERKEMLLKVCKELQAKNEADNFTATGTPKLNVVIEAAGFDLDRKELNSIWTEVLAGA